MGKTYLGFEFDFEANLKDGIAVDWPIRYKDIAHGMIMLNNTLEFGKSRRTSTISRW